MKPDTTTAMRNLIADIRKTMPFGVPAASVCSDDCNGCSIKLLEFLDTELMDWERRLDAGEVPNFGDLAKMAKIGQKIYKVMAKNGLVSPAPNPSAH